MKDASIFTGNTLLRCLGYIVGLLLIPIALFWWFCTLPVFSSGEASVRTVPPGSLAAHVRFLSEDCHPRNFQNHENLARAAVYIKQQFTAAGCAVEMQSFSDGLHEYQNVIGRLGPVDGPLIIVGAHYDSYDDTPGADDNASGVAGLIELARLVWQHPLEYRIEFVAYCLEEPPYFRSEQMGSFVHAARLKETGTAVELMVNLEMIGYFNSRPRSQTYPSRLFHLFYPSRGDFVLCVGKMDQRVEVRRFFRGMRGATPLDARALCAFEFIPGVDFSDHLNYWKHGYPAVMVTNTAFYRNPAYHTHRDTADRLNYHKMAEVVISVYAGLRGFQ
ncbi:MAG: M28 family peptidase [Verrucomicrobiota bacterium]